MTTRSSPGPLSTMPTSVFGPRRDLDRGCPRRPGRAASPTPGGRRRSRSPAAPGRRPARRRRARSGPCSVSTWNSVRRPIAGRPRSATQTATHSPVSSQRTSKSPRRGVGHDAVALGALRRDPAPSRGPACAAPADPCRAPRSSHRRPTRVSRPRRSRSLPVGSTTGRHSVAGVRSSPFAGSIATLTGVGFVAVGVVGSAHDQLVVRPRGEVRRRHRR